MPPSLQPGVSSMPNGSDDSTREFGLTADASAPTSPRLVGCTFSSREKVQDKRLQIELDTIRQSMFDGDGKRTTEVYPNGGDRVDWISTAAQITDCFTKSWKPTQLLEVLDTCKYQISREGYTKSSTGSKVAAGFVKQQELESVVTA